MLQASCDVSLCEENGCMDKVSALLPSVLHRRGLAQHAGSAVAVHRAQAWIAEHLPHIASFVRVRSVRDAELLIECTHPIAQQECQAVSADILAYFATNDHFVHISTVRTVRA